MSHKDASSTGSHQWDGLFSGHSVSHSPPIAPARLLNQGQGFFGGAENPAPVGMDDM